MEKPATADTPVKIARATHDKLTRLKVHPRETYDDVIRRLIDDFERRPAGEDARKAS